MEADLWLKYHKRDDRRSDGCFVVRGGDSRLAKDLFSGKVSVIAPECGLDASFYDRKQRMADNVAACVLVAPERAPSRDELPRDLVSCMKLRSVLRASILGYTDPARMAQLVARSEGMEYVCELLSLIETGRGGRWVLVSWLPWYCHLLRQMELLERDYEQHVSGLIRFLDASRGVGDG